MKRLQRLLCAAAALAACAAAQAPAAPAARIVTLSPHLTELVYAAGAGDRLVGVARYSDYPQPAKALARIGDATRIDIERVLALRPDLVLAWKSGNAAGDVARLERLGLKVHVSDAARFREIARTLRTIGRLAGTEAAAEAQAGAFERRIAALGARHRGRRQVRVFYQIWDRPLLTVNGRHIISDVLALCGGANVFAEAELLTPSVSIEAVAAARPEAVVGGSSASTPAEFEARWRRMKISALRDLPVIYVPPDLIQRATPRIAAGAAEICARLDEVRTTRAR